MIVRRCPVLLSLFALFAGAAVAPAATTFTWDSDPGDVVGGGTSGTLTDADGTWAVISLLTSNFGDVDFDFEASPPGDTWSLAFAAPVSTELIPGAYPDAVGVSGQSSPYIDIGHNGTSCGAGAGGSFTVTDASAVAVPWEL